MYFSHIHLYYPILSLSHSHQSSSSPQLAPLSSLHVCDSLAFLRVENRSKSEDFFTDSWATHWWLHYWRNCLLLPHGGMLPQNWNILSRREGETQKAREIKYHITGRAESLEEFLQGLSFIGKVHSSWEEVAQERKPSRWAQLPEALINHHLFGEWAFWRCSCFWVIPTPESNPPPHIPVSNPNKNALVHHIELWCNHHFGLSQALFLGGSGHVYCVSPGKGFHQPLRRSGPPRVTPWQDVTRPILCGYQNYCEFNCYVMSESQSAFHTSSCLSCSSYVLSASSLTTFPESLRRW